MYPLSVPGDTSVDLLKRIEFEIASRHSDSASMVIVIAIGINDSQFSRADKENKVPLPMFRTNLQKIISLARKQTSQIVVMGLTPVNDLLVNPIPWSPMFAYSTENVQKYNRALRKVAEEEQVLFLDIDESLSSYQYEEILYDGVHPNTKGHQVLFETLLKELKTANMLT